MRGVAESGRDPAALALGSLGVGPAACGSPTHN